MEDVLEMLDDQNCMEMLSRLAIILAIVAPCSQCWILRMLEQVWK